MNDGNYLTYSILDRYGEKIKSETYLDFFLRIFANFENLSINEVKPKPKTVSLMNLSLVYQL